MRVTYNLILCPPTVIVLTVKYTSLRGKIEETRVIPRCTPVNRFHLFPPIEVSL